MIAWYHEWRAGAPERRLRRQIRRESYVRCEGDVANSGPPLGMDYDVCFRRDCDQPNGGDCAAVVEERENYERKCASVGIKP